MRKSFFLKIIPAVIACGMPLAVPHASFLTATGAPEEMERLRRLSERIDSLEVERQMKRRGGQPLEEIESLAAQLRDSIKALRFELQRKDENASAPAFPKREALMHLFAKPDALFDWILVGAGGVAVLFGIVALFIHLNALSRRRKRSTPPLRRDARRAVQCYGAVPAASQSSAPEAAKPGTPRPPPPAPAIPEPAPPAAPPSRASSVEPKTVDDLIVTAYGEGIGVPEISRRYHVSADQVTLIVKMAKRARH